MSKGRKFLRTLGLSYSSLATLPRSMFFKPYACCQDHSSPIFKLRTFYVRIFVMAPRLPWFRWHLRTSGQRLPSSLVRLLSDSRRSGPPDLDRIRTSARTRAWLCLPATCWEGSFLAWNIFAKPRSLGQWQDEPNRSCTETKTGWSVGLWKLLQFFLTKVTKTLGVKRKARFKQSIIFSSQARFMHL